MNTGSDYPIELSPLDFRFTNNMRKSLPKWEELDERRGKEYEDFPVVTETIFNALFKPRYWEEEQLTRRGQYVKEVLNEIEKTTEWQRFREETKLNRVSSAIGTLSLGEKLKLPPPPDDPNEDMEEGEGSAGLLSDEDRRAVRVAAREAVQYAEQAVQDQKDAQGLLAGLGVEDVTLAGNVGKRLELAEKIKSNPRLKLLAQVVGKLRIIAEREYRDKVIHGVDEITDVKLGSNLPMILPQELVMLDPDFEVLFLAAFVEDGLLEYELEGTESVGNGPIVASIDISPSMRDYLRGPNAFGLPMMQKIDWAIALALSLTIMARKEKRDLYINFFNTEVVQTFLFEKGETDEETITKIASITTSGGTSFQPPLMDAKRKIEEEGFDKADIIFITDGLSGVSESFMKDFLSFKKKMNVKVYSILLHSASNSVLDGISDRFLAISDLREGEDALKMAFTTGGRL